MTEAEQIRALATRLDEAIGPAERVLAPQLESGDFAGPLADRAEEAVNEARSTLHSVAENLRDIADERE